MTSVAARKRNRRRNLAALREAQEASGPGIVPDAGRTGGGGRRILDNPRETVITRRCRALGWMVERKQEDGSVVMVIPDKAKQIDAVSPDYATPHWVAASTGAITRAMAEAGDIYAKQRGAYDALYLGQRLTAQSGVYRYVTDTPEERDAKRREQEARQGAYQRGYRAGGEFPDPEAVERARAGYEASHAALCKAGMLAEREVMRICVCLDEETPPKTVPLSAGLASLLAHYREMGVI